MNEKLTSELATVSPSALTTVGHQNPTEKLASIAKDTTVTTIDLDLKTDNNSTLCATTSTIAGKSFHLINILNLEPKRYF